MKVFISWSGTLSEQVARVLRDWLPTVIPAVQPWVSSEDIEKGARWLAQLSDELASTTFGILCIVPGNLHSSWLNFEAGALSRSVDSSRVSPFLLGVSASDLRGPLAQFQATKYEESDLRRLVLSLNKACGEQSLAWVVWSKHSEYVGLDYVSVLIHSLNKRRRLPPPFEVQPPHPSLQGYNLKIPIVRF